MGIEQILAAPFHPQTNGKIERYHRSLRGEINIEPYEMPSGLKNAIRAFVEYYNYRRYHEGLDNVTPWDMYRGKNLAIIARKKEVKQQTQQERKDYDSSTRGEAP